MLGAPVDGYLSSSLLAGLRVMDPALWLAEFNDIAVAEVPTYSERLSDSDFIESQLPYSEQILPFDSYRVHEAGMVSGGMESTRQQGIVTQSAIPLFDDQKNNFQQRGRTALEAEILFWQTIVTSDDSEDFKAYLRSFPNGIYVPLAHNRLQKLQ